MNSNEKDLTFFRLKQKRCSERPWLYGSKTDNFSNFSDRNETSFNRSHASDNFQRKFSIPSYSNETFFFIICFVVKFFRIFQNAVLSQGKLVFHSNDSPQINKHRNPLFIPQTPFKDKEQVLSFSSLFLYLIHIQHRTAIVHNKDLEHNNS